MPTAYIHSGLKTIGFLAGFNKYAEFVTNRETVILRWKKHAQGPNT